VKCFDRVSPDSILKATHELIGAHFS
jgi:hypothetical protein